MPLADRSREYWAPEPLFAGARVFLLGGGPSLSGFDAERLRGRRVVAINESARLCPFAELLYFTDDCWLDRDRGFVLRWPGLAVTASSAAKAKLPDKLKRVEIGPTEPLRAGVRVIRQGRSSGQIAVSLAIAMGAARVVLLGYDMRLVDGRSHYHDAYREKEDTLYVRQFAPAFAGWRELAAEAGVEIVNATPGSALTEFPFVSLEDELAA